MTSGLCGSSLRLFEGYLTEENSLSAFSEVMDYWTFGMSKIPLFKSWGPPSKGGPPSRPPSRSYSLRRLARLNSWLASRLAATFMAG